MGLPPSPVFGQDDGGEAKPEQNESSPAGTRPDPKGGSLIPYVGILAICNPELTASSFNWPIRKKWRITLATCFVYAISVGEKWPRISDCRQHVLSRDKLHVHHSSFSAHQPEVQYQR